MQAISKKELRSTVTKSIADIIANMKIATPSKRTVKVIKKVSKKLTAELNHELKKHLKKMAKATSRKTEKSKSKVALSA